MTTGPSGNVARRASAKLVQALLKADCAEALNPTQTCVGVASGMSMLAAGLGESKSARPEWVFLQLEFNEAARMQIITALLALSKRVKAGETAASFHHAGQVLARYCRAYLSPESYVVLSASKPVIAGFRSCEGMQQGGRFVSSARSNLKCEVNLLSMLSARPGRWHETVRDVPGPALSMARARGSLVSARGSRPNDSDCVFFNAGFDRVTDNEPVARLRASAAAAARLWGHSDVI
jgi:hypothetical protein